MDKRMKSEITKRKTKELKEEQVDKFTGTENSTENVKWDNGGENSDLMKEGRRSKYYEKYVILGKKTGVMNINFTVK